MKFLVLSICLQLLGQLDKSTGHPETQLTSEQLQELVLGLKDQLDSKLAEVSELKTSLKGLQNSFDDLQVQQNRLEAAYTLLETNPVPIGFTYIQLPGQPEPNIIWPDVTWGDVSFMYDSLFFRTVGNQSEAFGSIQDESCPRITVANHRGGDGDYNEEITIGGEWSNYVLTGYSYAAIMTDREKIRFYTEPTEVRPVNTAVRIWRRTM